MKRLSCIGLITTVSIVLLVRSLRAQTASGNQENASIRSSGESALVSTTDSSPAPISVEAEQTQFAPALDGTGLIPMDSAVSTRLLLGASASGGWDSNPDNLGKGASSAIYTLSPYFGVQANSARGQLLLQYQPTITGYGSATYSNQTMHVASLSISGEGSERWKWDLNAAGNYGQDSTRLLAPQQGVAIGEVPGTGPNSASYLPNAGTVTYITGSGGLHYRKSERDSIELNVANTFSRYSGLSENNSIATTSLGYDRDLSPSVEMRAYGQSYYYYGAINCTSFGGGLAIKWHVVDRTFLSLGGGPQFNTSKCGKQQGFSYSVAFSTRLTGKSQLYLLAAREPAISYLGPGLWQSGVSGGYQRQITTVGTLRFDVGYVSSDTLTTVNSYHGTYVDCVYNFQLGHGFSASYSYRGYVGDTGGTNFSRNVALFSIGWAPSAGHLFQ